jgi:polyribonucleotide nucleotidyltransferase
MATVCGASMSMMDAGVPLKSPIAGIAMGLIKEKDKFVVLSDIIADEDHLGDMDFKVAGGSEGITALQMDIKVAGITFDIMAEALEHARAGRLHILDKMNAAIASNRALSSNAPAIVSFKVNKDKIREIIGPGGKVIREICETTGAKIDITDDGNVSVAAVGKDKLDAAVAKIKEIAFDPEVGDLFDGTVVKVLESGAFVNYLGSRDGFVHISEISKERIESVGSVLSEGQKVKVKLIGFDRGKAKLTIKNAASTSEVQPLIKPEKVEKVEKKPLDNSVEEVVNDVPRGVNKNENKSEQREVAKKWKTKPSATDNNVTERKYFN